MLHPAAAPLIAAGIHAVDQHFGAVAAGAENDVQMRTNRVRMRKKTAAEPANSVRIGNSFRFVFKNSVRTGQSIAFSSLSAIVVRLRMTIRAEKRQVRNAIIPVVPVYMVYLQRNRLAAPL